MVAGFFAPDDLERLRFIRENHTSLVDTPIQNSIVDRSYQHEAIRRVAEDFSAGRRLALLVMATGTGETRTVMGLIDIFMRSHWAQRVLFVADRDALVEQALADGFRAHLPAEPRARIHTANIDTTLRVGQGPWRCELTLSRPGVPDPTELHRRSLSRPERADRTSGRAA